MTQQAGFTILFELTHPIVELTFTQHYRNFQAFVIPLADNLYKITRLNRYDVYEMAEMIGTYTLEKITLPNNTSLWKDVHTQHINGFIQAMGMAIEQNTKPLEWLAARY